MSAVRGLRAVTLTGVLAAAALVATGPASSPAASDPTAHSSAHSPSYDGRIVFADINTGNIATINPDGTARVDVTTDGATNSWPRWLPGSQRIVYASTAGAEDTHLFTVATDGSDPVQLTTGPAGQGDFAPAPTPDGQRVLFSRCRPDPPGGCALWSVALDGSDARQLTEYGERADLYPDVSPDGRRVAFDRVGDQGIGSRIWVSDLDGRHAHPVTGTALEAGYPRWTRDGRHLLVSGPWLHVGNDVYRVPDHPGRPQRLTHVVFPHNAEFASPSPSGAQIVYCDDSAFPGIIGCDLAVMDADGSDQHTVTSGGRLFEPDWGTAPILPSPAASPSPSSSPAPATRAATVPDVLPGVPTGVGSSPLRPLPFR